MSNAMVWLSIGLLTLMGGFAMGHYHGSQRHVICECVLTVTNEYLRTLQPECELDAWGSCR